MAAGKDIGYPWRWARRLVLWICLPYAALAAFYLLVFRLQARRLNNAARIFNKRILNPVMATLDRRHWYAAVLRHRGRHSGKEYVTPVTAEPTGDGFVIPLSYGEGVDWLKNERAAGRCTIEAREGTYTVGEPEVIDRAEALGSLTRRSGILATIASLSSLALSSLASRAAKDVSTHEFRARGFATLGEGWWASQKGSDSRAGSFPGVSDVPTQSTACLTRC